MQVLSLFLRKNNTKAQYFVYNLQQISLLMTTTDPIPDKIMPDDKRFSTEKLDDAMKELIDICQQYNDKISQKQIQQSTDRNKPLSNGVESAPTNFTMNGHREYPKLNRLFDKQTDRKQAPNATQCDNNTMAKKDIEATAITNSLEADLDGGPKAKPLLDDGSIDRLQQKQCKLQKQLDDVLEVARSLDLKQKKKLNNLIEGAAISAGADDDEEDIELIEFRQIENELRISELNRQLSNIQEQLRLRLYRRLSSRTSNESFKSAREHRKTPSPAINHTDSIKRRDSAQTDESTPSTSSCSDDPTASSSSISNMMSTSTKNNIDTELANQFERCTIAKQIDAFATKQSQQSNNSTKNFDQADCSTIPKCAPTATSITTTTDEGPAPQDAHIEDLEIAFDKSHNYEVLNPITGPNISRPPPSISQTNNFYTHIPGDSGNRLSAANVVADPERGHNLHLASNGLRIGPASNDLERIDEGEEDDNDYYCSSDQFRMVYETKISPIMHAAGLNSGSSGTSSDDPNAQGQPEMSSKHSGAHIGIKDDDFLKESNYSTPRLIKDRRFNPDNVNSAKRGGNRPLTLYLPKPDEEIDLIETVQALGHDLDILSTDIQFTPSTARGYLYKSCSNNSKKWLKRFFYFDRQTKALSYYENEEQLVKKINSPRSTIPFDEICDVYVDHRLNELNEKHKGTKRKSYVFVLATAKRKYLLASSKPEAMRAWIDVLFTAAKANDYFQQVGNDNDEDNEESLSFNYNSFTECVCVM